MPDLWCKSGIEAGHGTHDYLIDLSNGDSKAITPEGIAGVELSPNGMSAAVQGPDGNWGTWLLEGDGIRTIPGLGSNHRVIGWSPDGGSVYAVSSRAAVKRHEVYQVNAATGKMQLWRNFGEDAGAGVSAFAAPHLSSDGTAYAYIYTRTLSEAYVVTGLK